MTRIAIVLIVGTALAMGVGMYYAQVYAYYYDVAPQGDDVVLVPQGGGDPVTIAYDNFRGIDRDSSPKAFRACFDTSLSLEDARAEYEPYEGAAPLVAPGWFECYDAKALGAQIEAGEAQVFTGTRNIEYGIDRVVAITADGKGYAWQEINACGDKAYDGSPLGEDCPERE